MPVIQVKNLSYSYAGREVPALAGISFEIARGERTALLGANGSGKTTLLSLLNGLLVPPAGTVAVNASMGTVLQNPDDQIVSSVVEEDIAFGPTNLGCSKDEIRRRTESALKACGLENLKEKPPQFLSGGERQRLALAGVLALESDIVALDEAASMLDPAGRENLLACLDEISAAGKTILQITHSLEEAYRCGRCLVLFRGALVFDGAPAALIERPELGAWGFAVPESVKTIRRLASLYPGFSVKTLEPEETVEALKKVPGTIGEGGALSTDNLPHTETALAAPPRAPNPAGFPLPPDSETVPGTVWGVARNEVRAEGGAAQMPLCADERTESAPPTISFASASHTYLRGTAYAAPGMREVSFRLEPALENGGAALALVGASGSGKSTVMKHINALLLPQAGAVEVLGRDTLDKKTKFAELRSKAALCVQNPESALFEEFVADDVAAGPANLGVKGAELKERVRAAMEEAGLDFGEFADRKTRSLSGGEKRRAAIAGIAAMESEILILDEPLAGLDGFHQSKIEAMFARRRESGRTVVVSTHSMESAAACDFVGVMRKGTMAAYGPPREIFGAQWNPDWGLRLPWTAAVSRGLGLPAALSAEELVAALILHQIAITVKEDYNGKRFYDDEFLQEIKLTSGLPGGAGPSTRGSLTRPSALTILRNITSVKPSSAPSSSPCPPFPRELRENSSRKNRKRRTGIEFFRNVTLGQFLDRPSPLRNLPGGAKLILLIALAAAAIVLPPAFLAAEFFWLRAAFSAGFLAAVLFVGGIAGRIGPKHLLRGLLPVAPWLLVLAAVQFVYGGLNAATMLRAVSLLLRLASLMALFSLYSAVTPLRETLAAVNAALAVPAKLFGKKFPARDISLTVGIAFRFIPVLAEEAERIVTAQLSRGGKKGRAAMMFAMIVPLFLRALERSEKLAKAMILRKYGAE